MQLLFLCLFESASENESTWVSVLFALMNNIIVADSDADIREGLVNLIQQALENCADENFTVGLSGGSWIDICASAFPFILTDWSRWKFFFCDERLVPFNDKESTYGSYIKRLSGLIQESQFVPVDLSKKGWDCAKDYEDKINESVKQYKGLPRFNLLLLGMGPDGHTCSLFPQHPLLQETKPIAYIGDSPKPPCERITMTLPTINNAANIIFVVTGQAKVESLKRVLGRKELPAGNIKPNEGSITWIVDKQASDGLWTVLEKVNS